MSQRNTKVPVKANGRVIEVPQSYVDRFPDIYAPVKINQDGSIAKSERAEDARGQALPPFASKPSELPATGSSSTSTTPADPAAADASANTDGGTPA